MENVIICTVSTSFDIILESQVGSTGFGWCLKSIPAGVELAAIDIIPLGQHISPGSKERTIFTFVAVKPLKEGIIGFDLLKLTYPHCEIADTINYTVYVHDEDENDVLKKEIGGQKFVKGAGAMVHAKPIPPYGFTDPGKAILLYGFPVNPLYGYPVPSCGPNVLESKANCLLKYGNPFGVATDEAECNLKYGYPVVKYGYPPIYKYGFPMSNSTGKVLTVKEDAQNCIVKYGTPFGVANKAEDCTLKYGFPVQN
jgi:hypothetical protein